MTPFELWLAHQDETGQESHQAEIFYSGNDPVKGTPIGWRCKTCGASAGEVPA
jgi:hypothetical protein